MSSILVQRRLSSLRSAMQDIIEYLDDDSIIEVMLNPDGKIWIDRVGEGMSFTGKKMKAECSERMLRLVAAAMDTEINQNTPSLAAKLPFWGARVQASIPPIVEAPSFALRKPPKLVFTLDDYVGSEIITREQCDYLKNNILKYKNIVVSGGTGSGKTTLLNAMLAVVSGTDDRLFIVEDNPELQCLADNKIQILVIPGIYDHRRALMDALRYRPDRIIFGEVRDGAALDLLKAWNTGHPGGLATIHSDSPVLSLDRICQCIEEVVAVAPRYLVAEAVDICVSIIKDKSHPSGRRLNGIIQVEGVDASGAWKTRQVF